MLKELSLNGELRVCVHLRYLPSVECQGTNDSPAVTRMMKRTDSQRTGMLVQQYISGETERALGTFFPSLTLSVQENRSAVECGRTHCDSGKENIAFRKERMWVSLRLVIHVALSVASTVFASIPKHSTSMLNARSRPCQYPGVSV
jgi:hypothetical protein